MIFDKQILDIKQAEHLHAMGINMTDAALCHRIMKDGHHIHKILYFDGVMQQAYKLHFNYDTDGFCIIPTYTLQEVLAKLPTSIKVNSKSKNDYNLYIDYKTGTILYGMIIDDNFYSLHKESVKGSIIDTAYNMLCWVIDNKIPLNN